MSNKIAIYPGSFNPFTIGHLNILEKAEAIFGKENVIIAVGVNPEKVKTTYTTSGTFVSDPRIETIQRNLPTKKVEGFSGFLTDYIWVKEQEGYDVTIVKGLRNGDDLDYEVNQLRYLQDRKPDMKTIFLVCDKEYEHVSSSGYRACEAIQPGAGHKYLAKEPEPNYYIILDEQSVDNYATMADIPHNEEYLFRRIKVFYGTREECIQWKKENAFEEFNKDDYEIGVVIPYDKEQMKLYSISEKECHLTFGNIEKGGGVFVQRYQAPWIWQDYKKEKR